MTRISKEGEYNMKTALEKSIENVYKYVEGLANEALDSENIEKIIDNGVLIEKAVDRIKKIENGRNFSPEVVNAIGFFHKTCADALERMQKHYEEIKEKTNSIKEEQKSIDYAESILQEEDKQQEEVQEDTDYIEKIYTEAASSVSLDAKKEARDRLQSIYENIMPQLYTTDLLEQLSTQEIGDLHKKIDTIYTYRKELDRQIEEMQNEDTIEPISVNGNYMEQLEQTIGIPTMEELYDLKEAALGSSDWDKTVAISEAMKQSCIQLNEMLQSGEIPMEHVEEVQEKIEEMKEITKEIDSYVEACQQTSENDIEGDPLISKEEIDYYYQEAMNTRDKNYLIEIANYLDNCCNSYIDYMKQNEENASQMEGIVEDIRQTVAFIDQQILELSNYEVENEQNSHIDLWPLEKMKDLYDEVMNTTDLNKKREICDFIKEYTLELEKELENKGLTDEEQEKIVSKMQEVLEMQEELERHIVVSSSLNLQSPDNLNLQSPDNLNLQSSKNKKKGIKNLFVNTNWFKKNAKKSKEDSKKRKKFSLKRIAAYAIGIGIVSVTLATFVSAKAKSEDAKRKQVKMEEVGKKVQEASMSMIKEMKKAQTINTVSDSVSVLSQVNYASKSLTQDEKEEHIMDLVKSLRDKFNVYDGLNVTIEQALSLYIHLNAANSYENANDTLALDKLTRENLIKRYYVGLTKDREEFETYQLDDSDLSRLSADVQGLRNAVLNRVAVLNDQGKYEESREIIDIFKDFISEEALQDEADTLISSIQSMQTSDRQKKKEHIYRYYNYIFAGPKNGVRNFNQYGYYVDGDGKEMTYENQTLPIRTLTWFMDGFVGLNITNNLIPQDIINAKEAKLRDLSNLLRILGFKNCNVNYYGYGVDFDTPIDNKVKKSSSSTKSSSKSSTSTNIANVLETTQLDKEMDAGLKEHTNVGDSFKLSDNSTVTIVESGPSDATVIVQPDPGSAKVEDTTPEGTTEKETIEGGGNEKTEPIKFDPDPTDVVIDEGGEEISDESTEYEESISFEEDSTEEEYYEDPSTEVYYDEETTYEDSSSNVSTEVQTSSEEYSTQAEIYDLYSFSLNGKLMNTFATAQSTTPQLEKREIFDESVEYEEQLSSEEPEGPTIDLYRDGIEMQLEQQPILEEELEQLEIEELYSLRETLMNTLSYTQEYSDERYVKTYHI